MAATTQDRPREYHRTISNWWWLQRRNYLVFILREFSSVFVAYFLVVTLVQIGSLARTRTFRPSWRIRGSSCST